ncbi:MAG: phosphoribosylglycinamide formyltransferase, partial [Brevundimonas sp.]
EGPILDQETVPILPMDTPESLSQRVLAAEHKLYPRALVAFCRALY